MPYLLRFLVLWILGFACVGANAQTLPSHVDPGLREDVVDAGAVPALRFLTTTDFPPFNYIDEAGRLIGYNIDLANAICDRLGAACTIQAWPWDRVQGALADNQGDALIAGLAASDSAGERFDFSRVYLQLPARFVTRNAVSRVFDPLRIAGTVAVRTGSNHARLIAEMVPDVEIVGYDTEFAALAAIENESTDVFFGDAMRASFWLNQNPECCTFVGEPYFRPDLFGEGLSIAVPAGLDNVRVAINWALIRLQREGRMDELFLRWFPISFY